MNALSRLESLDKLLPDLFRNFGRPLRTAVEDFPAEIRLDVSEGEKEYTVRAEVPGAKKDDIRVTVDGTYVSITCEVRKERQKIAGPRAGPGDHHRQRLARFFAGP